MTTSWRANLSLLSWGKRLGKRFLPDTLRSGRVPLWAWPVPHLRHLRLSRLRCSGRSSPPPLADRCTTAPALQTLCDVVEEPQCLRPGACRRLACWPCPRGGRKAPARGVHARGGWRHVLASWGALIRHSRCPSPPPHLPPLCTATWKTDPLRQPASAARCRTTSAGTMYRITAAARYQPQPSTTWRCVAPGWTRTTCNQCALPPGPPY